MRRLRVATSWGRTTPAKAPDFSPTKKPNWCWPNHEYGFEFALWCTTEKKGKKHATKIKLLLHAGSLSVFQHHVNNDFKNCMILYCNKIKQNCKAETCLCLMHELCQFWIQIVNKNEVWRFSNPFYRIPILFQIDA